VELGVTVASWRFAKSSIAWADGSIPYRFDELGLIKTVARLVLGVLCVFAWRETMKPSLLRMLPPLFRSLEKLGLLLPRRFFTTASYVLSRLTSEAIANPLSGNTRPSLHI
jgi:hypothetical protein